MNEATPLISSGRLSSNYLFPDPANQSAQAGLFTETENNPVESYQNHRFIKPEDIEFLQKSSAIFRTPEKIKYILENKPSILAILDKLRTVETISNWCTAGYAIVF